MELKLSKKVPPSFYGLDWIQAALDRMSMSYYRHHGKTTHFDNHGPLAHALQRIKWYKKTRNQEWLVDAINFLVRELQMPSLSRAHWDKSAPHPEKSLWKASGKGRGDGN